MELIIKRKFDLITCLSKYKININGKDFVIDKSGDFPIQVDNAKTLKISVIAHKYYSSITEINNVKLNDRIVIIPFYNKLVMLFLFLISISGIIYSAIIDNSVLGWIPLLPLLGYQFYVFDLRRKSFFQIFVQK